MSSAEQPPNFVPEPPHEQQEAEADLVWQAIGEVVGEVEAAEQRVERLSLSLDNPEQARRAREELGLDGSLSSGWEKVRALLAGYRREAPAKSSDPYFLPTEDREFHPGSLDVVRHEADWDTEEPKAVYSHRAERRRRAELRAEAQGRLAEYKENLARYKENAARLQAKIIQKIRDNPDVSSDELMQELHADSSGTPLWSDHFFRARDIIESYVDNHAAIRRAREAYPQAPELFEAVFGQKPAGEIEVLEGPMSLHFRCHSLEDYALIYNLARKKDRNNSQDNSQRIQESAAVSIVYSKIPELKGLITAEKALGRSAADPASQSMQMHEEQHVIYKLFEKPYTPVTLSNYATTKESEDRERLLYRDLRAARTVFEEDAKNEILAYCKDEGNSHQFVIKALEKAASEGGLYDYFAPNREGFLNSTLELLGESNRGVVEQIIEDVFVQEYHQVIEDGISAYKAMLDRSGYTPSEVLAFFADEPLGKWKTVVRRHLEAKKVVVPEKRYEGSRQTAIEGHMAEEVQSVALADLEDPLFENDTCTALYIRTSEGKVIRMIKETSKGWALCIPEKAAHEKQGGGEDRVSLSFDQAKNMVIAVGKPFAYGSPAKTKPVTQIVLNFDYKKAGHSALRTPVNQIKWDYEDSVGAWLKGLNGIT